MVTTVVVTDLVKDWSKLLNFFEQNMLLKSLESMFAMVKWRVGRLYVKVLSNKETKAFFLLKVLIIKFGCLQM